MNESRPKVFCIGFHKTGTKSMASALTTLGYRVTGPNGAQNPDIARVALDIALKTVPEFDAFQDNPWPILWKEMDATFPGSKFVLTTRPADEWIASVVRHFGTTTTPMREWIYGCGAPVGHEERYLARYERHQDDVRLWFAGREDDLLVMDLGQGDGWDALCAFLSLPVPPVGFPHVNRAVDR